LLSFLYALEAGTLLKFVFDICHYMLQNQTIKFIFKQLRLYWRETLLGTFLLVLTNLIGVFIPLKIEAAVNFILKNGVGNTGLWKLLAFIAGLAVAMAIIRTFSRIVLFGIGRQVESNEKQEFYDHLLKLDILYFNTQRIGDLISRATSDIQSVRQMMGFGLLNVINIFWVYSLTLPVMVSKNASLTFWILIGYLPILLFVRHLSNKLKTQQQIAQEKLGDLSSFIEEDINGIQVIKAYSQENREIERFGAINNDYLKISIERAQWQGLIWPVMELAGRISFFVLLVYANRGALSAGTVAAFLIYLERLVFPTAIIGWLITIFQRGSVSVARIQEIFDQVPKIVDSSTQKLQITQGTVEVKDLQFNYNSHEQTLKGLSLKIEPGQFVGIVGVIGSGKSTLAQALVRLINIPAGTIFIDGQDITAITKDSLRCQVGLVPQESFLFNTTIAENIGFPGQYTIQQIQEAARLAQIHDEIVGFTEGYETIVGEKGVSLSGGQAQRIALARALINEPKILILDDSIASVDNEIGLKILEAFREKFKKQTLLLITHRISTLKEADIIYVIDNGQCIGSGKHSNLLRNNPIYQKLWKKQKLAGQVVETV
jgi:ATP-binding cassette, subfamily B, multidrug efflux pump